MSDYLVDNIFIRVFHCDIKRHDKRVVVIEGFKMSVVGYVLVLSDEVTDCVNIFYTSPLDVGYFIGSPPPRTILVGALSRFSRWVLSLPSKWLVGMGPCQAPPQLLSQYFVVLI